MTGNEFHLALSILHPDGYGDYTDDTLATPETWEEFEQWWSGPAHTPDEMEAARQTAVDRMNAARARAIANEQAKPIRSALFRVFNDLDASVQASFYGEKVKITVAFDDGNLAAALALLDSIETSTDEEAAAKESLLEIVEPLRSS